MENFNEFKERLSGPEPNTNSIIAHAFDVYKGIFGYGVVAMLIYIIAGWLIQIISGMDSQAVVNEINSSGGEFTTTELFAVKGVKTYYGLSSILGFLIAPLFIGLVYMANRYSSGLKNNLSDLFIGYRQNFIQIFVFSLIAGIITSIAFALCFLPGLFVAPLFLLGYPILLFENARALDALKKSVNIAKANYGTFLGTTLLGGLIAIAGVIFCGIGIILTFPFVYAVSYSAYCAFNGKPRELFS